MARTSKPAASATLAAAATLAAGALASGEQTATVQHSLAPEFAGQLSGILDMVTARFNAVQAASAAQFTGQLNEFQGPAGLVPYEDDNGAACLIDVDQVAGVIACGDGAIELKFKGGGGMHVRTTIDKFAAWLDDDQDAAPAKS